MWIEEFFSNIPQWLLNQIIAFAGSFLYICYLLLMFENKWNKDNRLSWKKYWRNNRFDFLILIVMGQVITAVGEYLFSLYVVIINENGWDFYYEIEEAIAFLIGVFALHLFSKMIGMGRKKIDSL